MQYRPDIDGLRGLAVVLVALFHFGADAIPGGFIGVDVFFVISGFLITGILAEAHREGRLSLTWFYVRRIRRIIPAMVLVVASSLLVGKLLLPPADFASLRDSAIYATLSLANFYFLANTGYFGSAAENTPLLHLWSLGVEEQFYIVWPLLLIAFMKIARERTLVFLALLGALMVASLALSVQAVATDPSSAFYLPHTRAWELGIGAMLAFAPPAPVANAWAREAMRLSGLALIGYSAVELTPGDPFPGLNALAPCLGAALLIWPLAERSRISETLGSPPARGLGLISYSLYLWHWPILVYFRHWTGSDAQTIWEVVLLASASTAPAWLTWKYVEQPFRKWQPRPILARGMVSLFALVTAAGTVTFLIAGRDPYWSAERLIVREQLGRAASTKAADLAFFGDSSCLTGIDPPTLRAELKIERVESFCMFGSAGPVADAKAIELLASRQALPKVAVIVIHPVQFPRAAISDQWVSFIQTAAAAPPPADTPNIPVQGIFADRYPHAPDLVAELRRTGALVDARRNVNPRREVSFSVPRSFELLLAPLAEALRSFDARQVYLLMPPLPERFGTGNRQGAAMRVATILGVPDANVLPVPPHKPLDWFATVSHLNESGRVEFSRELANIIRKRLSTQSSSPIHGLP